MNTNSNLTYLLIGAGTAIGTYRVLSHIFEQSSHEFCSLTNPATPAMPPVTQQRTKRHAWYGSWNDGDSKSIDMQALDLDALGQLAMSSNYKLRTAASDLLYDRAMTREMLTRISATLTGDDADERVAVVKVVQVLAQTAGRRSRLSSSGVLDALVVCVKEGGSNELRQRAASAIFDILNHHDVGQADRFRRRAARAGLLPILRDVMVSDTKDESANLTLVGLCAMITQLYALRTLFHRDMIDLGFLPGLLGVAKKGIADLALLRVVMESIVRLCTYLSTHRTPLTDLNETNPHMLQLLDQGAVEIIAACIRQDDQGVSSWGIGLLHEFVSRSVGKDELAASPNIVRWLCRNLSTTKYAYTNQLILRSLWCLCLASKTALADLAAPPNLRRVLTIFSMDGDVESHYWAIALVGKVSASSATHKWILSSPFSKIIVNLVNNPNRGFRNTLLPELSGIIARLTHCIDTAPLLARFPELARACKILLSSEIQSARSSAIMSIINATATSHQFMRLVSDSETVEFLMEMMRDSSEEQSQNYAAKGLAALLYAQRLDAELLVDGCRALLASLNENCRVTIDAYFRHSNWREPVEWSAKTFGLYLSTASVVMSPLQVLISQVGTGDSLAAETLTEVLTLQHNLLAFLAIYIMHALDLGKSSERSAGLWSDMPAELLLALCAVINTRRGREQCARVGVNTVVTAYYINRKNDPHFQAAMADNTRLLRSDDLKPFVLPTTPKHAEQPWTVGSTVPWPKPDGEFVGEMASARMRCLVPVMANVLCTLADSLAMGLVVQSPVVTHRAVWLARIIYQEFPLMRGIVMRLCSTINLSTLNAVDAASVLAMCQDFVKHGTRADAATYNHDSTASKGDNNDDDVDWRTWLSKISHMGLCDEGDLSSAEYFAKHPDLKPSAVAELGRFYAQYALDRYIAGWNSCLTVFRAIASPCATATPESCWAIDRSGPRGDPKDMCDDVRAMVQVASGSNTGSGGGGQHTRINRPPSPFPTISATIASPAEMTVTAPKPLASALPAGPVFTTQDPFYPCFEALADGRTVWNPSPKFESVRMRIGIDGRLGGVHRFSARLLTGGLVQIGWCTEHCVFYPESGQGVGDDYESVAYDGSRCRKWFGIAEENEYGEAWEAGDVVCVELDLDLDRVVFYRNGVSMGIAFGLNEDGVMEGTSCGFQDLPKDRIWYPAVSLATAQGVEFLGMELKSRVPVPALPPLVDDDVLRAFRIKVECEDLDSFPYITLSLPGTTHGQIIVAPVVDPRGLSTYLQPQWWVVWVPPADSISGHRSEEPAPKLSRWFTRQVSAVASADGNPCCRGAVLGTSPEWVSFAVLRNGSVRVSAGESSVSLDVGLGDEELGAIDHVWLPRVSSAIVRFEFHTL